MEPHIFVPHPSGLFGTKDVQTKSKDPLAKYQEVLITLEEVVIGVNSGFD